METTGNAGGVFNLNVAPTAGSLQQLMNAMNQGLLVTDLFGQGVNLMTGDYSRGAFGFWVDQGEIQYPVEGITIASNLKDMFQQILAVGSDIDARGNIKTGSILIKEMVLSGGLLI